MVKLKQLSEVRPHGLTTVYGMPGKGKTNLISSLPDKVLVLDADNGLSTIMKSARENNLDITVAQIESWEDFLDALDEAKNFDSIAIDHMTKIQQMLYEYLVEQDKKAKRMTLQLYGFAKEEMILVTDTLVRLANQGKNVYVICQEKQYNLEDDEDSDVPKLITADLQSSIRDYLLASCALVANARTFSTKEKVDGKVRKTTQYGLVLKDSNIYTLKVRTPDGEKVPEKIIDPTWADLMELIGVTPNEGSPKTKKRKNSKKTKGE